MSSNSTTDDENNSNGGTHRGTNTTNDDNTPTITQAQFTNVMMSVMKVVNELQEEKPTAIARAKRVERKIQQMCLQEGLLYYAN